MSSLPVAGKTVLVRVDYNVTLVSGTNEISDDSRIKASLPTLRSLMSRGARIVLCSHLQSPKGQIDEALRLGPIARRLSTLLEKEVVMAPDCIGEEVSELICSSPDGVIMLENLRFHDGEEANDPGFAHQLASLADVYVDDAFGTAHRSHASTQGVTKYLPSATGLLMERELETLGGLLENPGRPLKVVLGGAKVSDKIGIITHLADNVDSVLIGGGMAAAFLKALGHSVGASKVEHDDLEHARSVVRLEKERGFSLLTPTDVVVADRFEEGSRPRTVESAAIPDQCVLMDIGDATARSYCDALRGRGTIFWNGPMGVFEWESFSHGTRIVATAIADSEATTVIGGGSTADVVYTLGLDGKMSHVSTGGGATLEFLQGKQLPGVAAIPDA